MIRRTRFAYAVVAVVVGVVGVVAAGDAVDVAVAESGKFAEVKVVVGGYGNRNSIPYFRSCNCA